MKDVGYVTGSAAQAEELIIGTDIVYVHTEITKLDPAEGEEQAPLFTNIMKFSMTRTNISSWLRNKIRNFRNL